MRTMVWIALAPAAAGPWLHDAKDFMTHQSVPGRTRKIVRSVSGMESPREKLERLGGEKHRTRTSVAP
jgi:hypothetical protein